MPLSPILYCPVAQQPDIYWFSKKPHCAEKQLKALECVEAYGIPQGGEKCRILLLDFRECLSNFKAKTRVNIMRAERIRQFRAGERETEFEELPRLDSL